MTISLKAEELVAASYSTGVQDTTNNPQLDSNTEASLVSIKEEDHIDIDLEEKSENHWTNHIFKEKGQGDERSIVIRLDELLDFIHTTKATFAVFRVKRNDDNFRAERYFLMYIVF
jgi:biopolymer transport protein ExbD